MATERKYLSLEKLGLYDEKIKKVITDGDAASLQSAKNYADESFGLANETAASLANAAEANAKAYADGKDAAIAEAKKAGTDAAAAAAAADGKAVAAQANVDALETYVGTFTASEGVDTVVKYIDAKTANIASDETVSALANRVSQVETDIDNIEKDYLKAADKTELEGEIATAKAAGDGAKSYAEGVAGDLAEAVEALEGVDTGLGNRITALESTITGLSGAMHFEGVVETDPTTITTGYEQGDVVIYGNKEYVWNNGAFVEFGDASINAEAISGLATRVTTAEGKITTAEGKISDLEGAVATKVEQSVYDAKIAALEGVDTSLGNRITTLEGKFGGADGSVEDMIADAKAEAIEAAASDAASKDAALKTEIETAYKKYADDEDAKIKSRVDALEADTHTHSNKELLDTYTQTEANLADAVAKKHEHANAAVINAITADNVTTWNTVTSKASQTDLDNAVARIAANEASLAAFVEISESEINALFQQ